MFWDWNADSGARWVKRVLVMSWVKEGYTSEIKEAKVLMGFHGCPMGLHGLLVLCHGVLLGWRNVYQERCPITRNPATRCVENRNWWSTAKQELQRTYSSTWIIFAKAGHLKNMLETWKPRKHLANLLIIPRFWLHLCGPHRVPTPSTILEPDKFYIRSPLTFGFPGVLTQIGDAKVSQAG